MTRLGIVLSSRQTMLTILVALCLLLTVTTTKAELYVTMGDAYAAGAGMRKDLADYDDEDCRRMDQDVPGGWYAEKHDLVHVNVACHSTIYFAFELLGQLDTVLTEYPKDNYTGFIFTVMSGLEGIYNADDLNPFRYAVFLCSTVLRCDIQYEIVDFEDSIVSEASWMKTFLNIMVSRVPDATIRVVQYPLLFLPVSRLVLSRCWRRGLSHQEAQLLDGIIASYNAALQQAVEDVKVVFPGVDLDIVAPQLDRGVCQFPLPFTRQVYPSSLTIPRHLRLSPTKRGYEKIYEAIERNLEETS